MSRPRFAIYFVPAVETDLYRFGAAVLGYDCYTGEDLGYPSTLGVSGSQWEELTREPGRYGFHATLKAPFSLADSLTEAELATELQHFAGSVRAVPIVEPTVQLLGSFVAIVTRSAQANLAELAAECVAAFDGFRAPLAPDDRSRRKDGLSERQIAHLDRWGYPYVFDEFRFHMTLTGRIAPDRRAETLALLQGRFATACGGSSFPLDRLVLVRQESHEAKFRVVCHADLPTA